MLIEVLVSTGTMGTPNVLNHLDRIEVVGIDASGNKAQMI